jgi:hypothetical protein
MVETAGYPKPSPKPAQEDCAADTSVVSGSYQTNTADCSTIQNCSKAPMWQCITVCASALNAIVIVAARRAVHQHERKLNM